MAIFGMNWEDFRFGRGCEVRRQAGTKLWKITKINTDASEEIEVKLLRNDCESKNQKLCYALFLPSLSSKVFSTKTKLGRCLSTDSTDSLVTIH